MPLLVLFLAHSLVCQANRDLPSTIGLIQKAATELAARHAKINLALSPSTPAQLSGQIHGHLAAGGIPWPSAWTATKAAVLSEPRYPHVKSTRISKSIPAVSQHEHTYSEAENNQLYNRQDDPYEHHQQAEEKQQHADDSCLLTKQLAMEVDMDDGTMR